MARLVFGMSQSLDGYVDDAAFRETVGERADFLQKPFSPFGLAQAVRETLDRRRPSSS